MHKRNILEYAVLLAALLPVSCNKNDRPQPDAPAAGVSSVIRFEVPNLPDTKAGIETIDDIVNNIRIRGTRGGAVINNGVYENIGIEYDSNTGLWAPILNGGQEATWAYKDTESNGIETIDIINNNYSFCAYAFNSSVPSGATEASVTLTTTGDAFGTKLTGLSQPEVYVHDSGPAAKPFGYDYVLSQKYNVSTQVINNKVVGDVVKFHMEHALASIKVNLFITERLYRVSLLGIRINGFYRTADMTCSDQAIYGNSEGKTNQWTVENLRDLNSNGYQRGVLGNEDAPVLESWTTGKTTEANGEDVLAENLLQFCAIPQLLGDAASLSVSLLVEEYPGSPTQWITQSWDLKYFDDWISGQKNKYTISIDPSSELISTFEDWIEITDVNGTILPEL